ncbi:hypothetical protein GE09DRAFT_1234122 [Coniochaeta sp. 2T2.1]|nr:hypothetical protein GE09DRAFT_1234122 [Coniochaeta sp. 2T2.1]
MVLLRSRVRWSRFIILAAILTGLYYVSFHAEVRHTDALPFPLSSAWSRLGTSSDDDGLIAFDEPERPRPKMPAPPLPRKHKTRNGRPPAKVGPPGASSGRGSEGGRKVPAPRDGRKIDASIHHDGNESKKEKLHVPPEETEEKDLSKGARSLPPPAPPGLHLPDPPPDLVGSGEERQTNSWIAPEQHV